MLTAERLREVLNYDPETGVFTWRVSPANRPTRPGDIAGYQNKRGYHGIKMGRLYKTHRLAWLHQTGAWPEHEIDHINLDKSDNRFENLREATHGQNRQNRRARADSFSGVKGVFLKKTRGYPPFWWVQIKANGRRYTRCCHGTLGERLRYMPSLPESWRRRRRLGPWNTPKSRPAVCVFPPAGNFNSFSSPF